MTPNPFGPLLDAVAEIYENVAAVYVNFAKAFIHAQQRKSDYALCPPAAPSKGRTPKRRPPWRRQPLIHNGKKPRK